MFLKTVMILPLICLSLFARFSVANEHSLQIITEDWAPYNYVQDDKLQGFSVDIVQAIMEEMGVHHEIAVYPGARGELMLDTLPNIMSFSLFRTPEREHKYKWIGPISDESIYFFKRKDDTREFKTIEDLKAVNGIVVPHKGLVHDHVQALGITNINELPSRESQFLYVLMGRADLSVNATQLGVAYYLKKLNKEPDALVPTKVQLLKFPLYIACSKNIPESIIVRWQNALDKIKSSGKYQLIYNKHLSQ